MPMMTRHAFERMEQRNLTAVEIAETLEKGKRQIYLDRGAYRYVLKMKDGWMCCVVKFDGYVVTAYFATRPPKRKKS